jgi:hypothetical protein
MLDLDFKNLINTKANVATCMASGVNSMLTQC